MPTAMPAVSSAAVETRRCRIFSRSPAPKYLAMGTPKPAQLPMQKPSTRNCTLLLAPTPARAFTAQHLPHNGRVDNIIRLLQQVSRQQRQCKRKHQLQRTALCHGCRHVFTSYHFIAGFYGYRLFYHQCPAPAMNRFAPHCSLTNGFAVVQHRHTVQKQHVLPVKSDKPIQKLRGNITNVDERNLRIPLGQQRRDAAAKGIPKQQ